MDASRLATTYGMWMMTSSATIPTPPQTAARTQAYRDASLRDQRDALILEHLPLVRHVLGKLLAQLPAGVDIENLESAGVLGLVETANKFDPNRGIQFKTYAYTRIRGAVLDELRRNCPLPQLVLQRVTRIRKAYRDLPAPVTVDALAAATGLTADEVADALAAFRLTKMVSWNESTDRMIGTYLDDRQEPPDAEALRSEQEMLLKDAIMQLIPRERTVVTLYYLEDLRLAEIGEVMNLSESRVSRILHCAMFHLAEFMREKVEW